MKYFVLFFLVIFSASVAGADRGPGPTKDQGVFVDEGVMSDTRDVLQAAIVRHQGMTHDQIVADIETRIEASAVYLQSQGVNFDVQKATDELSKMTKEQIIQAEQAQAASLSETTAMPPLMIVSYFKQMEEWSKSGSYGQMALLTIWSPFVVAGTALETVLYIPTEIISFLIRTL